MLKWKKWITKCECFTSIHTSKHQFRMTRCHLEADSVAIDCKWTKTWTLHPAQDLLGQMCTRNEQVRAYDGFVHWKVVEKMHRCMTYFQLLGKIMMKHDTAGNYVGCFVALILFIIFSNKIEVLICYFFPYMRKIINEGEKKFIHEISVNIKHGNIGRHNYIPFKIFHLDNFCRHSKSL